MSGNEGLRLGGVPDGELNLREPGELPGPKPLTPEERIARLEIANAGLEATIEEVRRQLASVTRVTDYLGPRSPLHEDAGLREIREHNTARIEIEETRTRQKEQGRRLIGDRLVIEGLTTKAKSAEKPNRLAVATLKTVYTGTALALGTFAGYEAVQAVDTLRHIPNLTGDVLSAIARSPLQIDTSFPFIHSTWGEWSANLTTAYNKLVASGQNLTSQIGGAAVTSLGTLIILLITHPWRSVVRNSSFFGPKVAGVLEGMGKVANLTGIDEEQVKKAAKTTANVIKREIDKTFK